MSLFTLGSYRCALLRTGSFDMSSEVLFGRAPERELDAALARHGLARGTIVFEVHPLFVDTGRNRVLVDPGVTGDPARLLAALGAEGIDPASIDTIVLTHGHADHYSGLIRADGSAAFPAARHVVQRAEWEHWLAADNPEPNHAAAFRALLLPLGGHFDLVEGPVEIVPGIEAVPSPGHSPGHMAVAIGDVALHAGDAIIDPLVVEHPEWAPTFELRPEDVVSSARMLLTRLADERRVLVTAHFPWPGLGRVARDGGGFRWVAGPEG